MDPKRSSLDQVSQKPSLSRMLSTGGILNVFSYGSEALSFFVVP